MIRIKFQGSWPPQAAEQAMLTVRDTLREALHLDAEPAHYRVERVPGDMRQLFVRIDLFPAGSARSRRTAAQQMQDRLAQTQGLPAACVFVAICSPQQERVEMQWKT